MSTTLVTIDGSAGEGGGQILRSALALALVTGRPVRIANIRAGRKRPGLMRQHRTALDAAAAIGNARVEGGAIGSTEVTFEPGAIVPGEHRFAVGTAGSATLVLQTVLPALVCAGAPSTLVLEGGTHNPLAPPFDFLERAFLPLLRRMGPGVEARLDRHGFYPAGGGQMTVTIDPVPRLTGFELLERGAIEHRRGTVLLSHLPRSIAEREIAVLRHKLGWDESAFELREVPSPGPGNVVLLEAGNDRAVEVVTTFGELGVSAEAVAHKATDALRRYLAADVAVGEHLADQILLPLALAGKGAFSTLPLSRHATTQIALIDRFLGTAFAVERDGDKRAIVRIGS